VCDENAEALMCTAIQLICPIDLCKYFSKCEKVLEYVENL
jgi:hypothetical protein